VVWAITQFAKVRFLSLLVFFLFWFLRLAHCRSYRVSALDQ